MPSASRSVAGRSLPALALVLLMVLIGAGPVRAEVDPDTAVPPVCVNPDMAFWNAHAGDYQDNLTGSSASDLRLHTGWGPGVGTLLNCAFQSQQQSYQVCTGPGGGTPCHAEFKFVPGIPVSAAPDTIDAAGGDGQTVTLKVPGATTGYMDQAARATWGSCFPGTTYAPGFCDPTLFRFGPGQFVQAGGQMLYRFRDETGTFRGPWTLSYGKLSPGFKLEHTSPLTVCDKSAEECQYQVVFQRDTLNKPDVNRDVQVLLLLTVHEGVYPDDQWVDAAVPMLVIQSGGGDASGQGNGGGGGGTPSAGPPTAGGGPGTPIATPPPAPVARPAPPVLPRAAQITVGAVRAGALRATFPAGASGVRASAVLTVAATQARRLGLRVPKGARTATLGTGTATATGAGPLAVPVRLTAAARAALRRAARRGRAVRATLALTLTGPGGTAGPVLKPVTLRP